VVRSLRSGQGVMEPDGRVDFGKTALSAVGGAGDMVGWRRQLLYSEHAESRDTDDHRLEPSSDSPPAQQLRSDAVPGKTLTSLPNPPIGPPMLSRT
jgi:hypothetical protein